MFRSITMLAFIAMVGCGATYTEPRLPADHPANPMVAAAPAKGRSKTLDLVDAEPIVPVNSLAPGGDHHHGAQTGAASSSGDNAQPGQGHAGAPTGAQPTPSATALYACPMHPEVTGDKPDQRCPKCGMKLKKVEAQEGNRP
jgi:hypothetical protein